MTWARLGAAGTLLMAAALASSGCAGLLGADFDRPAARDAAPGDGEEEGGAADGSVSSPAPPCGAASCFPEGGAAALEGGSDARVPVDARAADGAAVTCSGTATACSTFTATGPCTAQRGCSFTAGHCSGKPNCSTSDPNVCSVRPGCDWDFTNSACIPVAGGCDVDESGCSSRGCTWNAGECTGAPTSCSSLGPADCATQSGCAV